LSAHSAEVFFLAVGVILLAMGIPILVASLNVKAYSARYDDAGPMAPLTSEQRQAALWNQSDGIRYSVDILVEETMNQPVSHPLLNQVIKTFTFLACNS